MRIESVDKHLKEKLKDPYFKELYELEEQKLEIVKRIIEYRIKHDLNQRRLAEKVGVTQQHISKIESGDFANVMTLEKVLLAIGFTVRMKVIQLKPVVANRIRKVIHSKRAPLQMA
ncbi:MAG: helix-turn-helix transcriptional regulator [Candidatus Omnitrophica bacterium]|nr:helix-turn-helix transcriptional regulator [Candidatus Omnitrophota bacterium]